VVGAGASIAPAFTPTVTRYTISLAPGARSVSLTPQVAYPDRVTITVGGINVAAGTATTVFAGVGFVPRVVDVVVTTETGASRVYTVVLRRTSVYVKASNTGAVDRFGSSVALSADGNVLAVGAPGEGSPATGVGGDPTSDAASFSGAVYVFRRGPTGAWAQEAYVKASNTGSGDAFGFSVSLSGDGSVLAVGALEEDSAATGVGGTQLSEAALESGAVYLLRRSLAGVWAQEAYVKPSNTSRFDYFGWALALSADGASLAVGAVGEASSTTGIGGDGSLNDAVAAGAVYVFRRAGGNWSQEAYVKASNTGPGDRFGSAVDLSANGSVLVVGAPWEDSASTGLGGLATNEAAPSAGAAYVFRRSTSGMWAQELYAKASNTDANDRFGWSVAMSDDGAVIVIGAPGEDSAATGVAGVQASNAMTDAGAAYVLRRVGFAWTQEAYLKASNTDFADEFGHSVALAGDGGAILVGAPSERSNGRGIDGAANDNSLDFAGAAYVFRRGSSGGWAHEVSLKASNPGDSHVFGWSVALSNDGSTAVIGAREENSAATGIGGDQLDTSMSAAGAVYAF
jgi:hypothetical protein